VTRPDVATAHEAGFSVAPWATSDPEIMRELIASGVDAIATNHPEVLRDVLAAADTARNVVTGSSRRGSPGA
jgi:glycerophosphoryl diester phosphodiesterase